MENTQENRNNFNLYIKVYNAIKNAKIEKYLNDKEKICKEGITFWGGITGKNNLLIEKLRNVKLKIELVQSEIMGNKAQYETEELLADLFACSMLELGGKFNEEMESVYNELKSKAENENKSNSDEYIYELACKKIEKEQNYLPIIHEEKPKGIFSNIRVQTAFLKLENQKLENEIVIQRGKCQFDTFDKLNNKGCVIVPTEWKSKKTV